MEVEENECAQNGLVSKKLTNRWNQRVISWFKSTFLRHCFLFFKRFIVPSSMHIQHHYRKNIQNNFLFLNKTTHRKQSKTVHNKKRFLHLSYKFQREESKNLTVFFYLDMTIGLIKYCFQLCKLSNFLFHCFERRLKTRLHTVGCLTWISLIIWIEQSYFNKPAWICHIWYLQSFH